MNEHRFTLEQRDKLADLRDKLQAVQTRAQERPLSDGEKTKVDELSRAVEKTVAEAERDYERRLDNIEAAHRRGSGEAEPGAERRVSQPEHESRALRTVERYARELPAEASDRMDALIRRDPDGHGFAAKYVAAVGDPAYSRAFGRILADPMTAQYELDREEIEAVKTVRRIDHERAMSIGTDGAGGYAVPYQLDPTIILSSNGQANPLREIARVEATFTNTWKGITSTGSTAAYAAEATEASDNSPTLVQPEVDVLRAQAFVPFSIELGQDWGALQAELAKVIADAKDSLEATKFVLGTGTVEPTGIVAGLGTAYHVQTAASATFALADVYSLQQALPPRFQPGAAFIASNAIWNLALQFETTNGAVALPELRQSPPRLLRKATYEVSTMSATAGTADKIMVVGDFRNFLIADRVGMTIELIPHLFGGSNRYPTGQRGAYAIWRNSSVVLTENAFRLLKVKAT